MLLFLHGAFGLVNNMLKYLVALIAITGIGGAYYGVQQFGAAPKVTLDNPQVVVWTKPTTDAGWAEDIKAENFDIKSTGKLTEMRDVHVAKLKRVEEGKREVFECRECIDFKYKQANPDWKQIDVDNNYANELAQANWEVEKLKQSVERMDNELRLRDKGFVVVEGEAVGLFGGSVDPQYVRKIND